MYIILKNVHHTQKCTLGRYEAYRLATVDILINRWGNSVKHGRIKSACWSPVARVSRVANYNSYNTQVVAIVCCVICFDAIRYTQRLTQYTAYVTSENVSRVSRIIIGYSRVKCG